jgi:uncharacterized protein (TIGR03086 family)
MTETRDLEHAQRVIGARVRALGADDWGLATPCTAWDVRALVVHLVEGSHMTARLLDGATPDEARAVFGLRHPHVVDEMAEAFAAELAGFNRQGALTTTVHHPAAGDIAGLTLLEFRTTDYVLHTWDLARTTGGDEHLPHDLVSTVWEALQPMAPFIAKTGVYGNGPSATLGDDASLQTRLLDLSGRRP